MHTPQIVEKSLQEISYLETGFKNFSANTKTIKAWPELPRPIGDLSVV
jgi:hypothetical protein